MNRRDILQKCWQLFSPAAILSLLYAPLLAQQPLPLNLLTFKGTHNSYACCGGKSGFPFLEKWDNSCPVIHDSPARQIDDWGVWALELDFGMVEVNGIERFVVGHNGPNDEDNWTDSDWGYFLTDFLVRINDTKALRYRPLFLYLQKESWDDKVPNWQSLLGDTLSGIFGSENVFGNIRLAMEGHWPTVPELAGKVIPILMSKDSHGKANGAVASKIFFLDTPTGITRVGPPNGFDSYTNLQEMEAQKAKNFNGKGIILTSDQYQENWTFELAVPPNPLYVRKGISSSYSVINTIGHQCEGCVKDPADIDCSFIVNQQGTFRFPFRTVSQATKQAEPGWTVLINAGRYRETLVIDKPVTLKADGGTVTIGW